MHAQCMGECAVRAESKDVLLQVGDLEAALGVVKEAKEVQLAAGRASLSAPPDAANALAEDGLRHLLLFIDVENLYQYVRSP